MVNYQGSFCMISAFSHRTVSQVYTFAGNVFFIDVSYGNINSNLLKIQNLFLIIVSFGNIFYYLATFGCTQFRQRELIYEHFISQIIFHFGVNSTSTLSNSHKINKLHNGF